MTAINRSYSSSMWFSDDTFSICIDFREERKWDDFSLANKSLVDLLSLQERKQKQQCARLMFTWYLDRLMGHSVLITGTCHRDICQARTRLTRKYTPSNNKIMCSGCIWVRPSRIETHGNANINNMRFLFERVDWITMKRSRCYRREKREILFV
jgi:hypothetical protein